MKTCCQIYQERLEEARRRDEALYNVGHSCGISEWVCQNCGFRRPNVDAFHATVYVPPVEFERYQSQILPEAGPDVEASHIIAEWKKGRSSTEIAELLKLPEHYVAYIIRREIIEHPQEQMPKEETQQTINRIQALKREIKGRKKT